MSRMQKWAWFNLSVLALTTLTVLSLVPLLGPGALGGFGFLGPLGFGCFFFRKKPGEIATDERDTIIQQRSVIIAQSVFWVVFVFACVLAGLIYEDSGAVPVVFIQASVWCGFMVLFAVMSVSILIQYCRG